MSSRYMYRVQVRLDGPAWRGLSAYCEREQVSLSEGVRQLCQKAGPRPVATVSSTCNRPALPVPDAPRVPQTAGRRDNNFGRFFMETRGHRGKIGRAILVMPLCLLPARPVVHLRRSPSPLHPRQRPPPHNRRPKKHGAHLICKVHW